MSSANGTTRCLQNPADLDLAGSGVNLADLRLQQFRTMAAPMPRLRQ